jgi:hypothetical protein
MCPRGRLLCSRHGAALGQGNSRVLALEPSWRDGIAITVPPFSGVFDAFDEGPSRPVTMEAGFERNAV